MNLKLTFVEISGKQLVFLLKVDISLTFWSPTSVIESYFGRSIFLTFLVLILTALGVGAFRGLLRVYYVMLTLGI